MAKRSKRWKKEGTLLKRKPEPPPEPGSLAEGWEIYDKTGDPMPYTRARLKGAVIPSSDQVAEPGIAASGELVAVLSKAVRQLVRSELRRLSEE